MNLNELLPHLSGVRKGWHGYAAKCPAHNDKVQSLSLAEGDGRILVKCFAGCSTESILATLNLGWKDLFDKRILEPSTTSLGEHHPTVSNDRPNRPAMPPVPSNVHTVYKYVDAQGELLYENVRFYPKDFRQRHYDENGQPVWNLNGVERVPYRLPDLIRSSNNESDIFLCEGEKDADSLRELGLTASSFKNWRPEFSKYVRGRHVVIMQDHDMPGVMQAHEAARLISRSAASVKIVDVFAEREMPEKHGPDVSDFIRVCVQDEGLGADEIKERLCQMVDRTDRWKETAITDTSNYFDVRSGNDWLEAAKLTPVPKMLCGEFWYEGELCILFADTNVGKSILAVQIADAISRGVSIRNPNLRGEQAEACTLRVDCGPQKVVYFDFELTMKQFESRFAERAADSETFVNHYTFHQNFYRAEINPKTTDLKGFDKFEDFLNHSLEAAIIATGAKVMIIDNLTYLRDETENARAALPLMKYLKELKEKHGVSILALAHTPKRDSLKPLGQNDLQGSKMLINFCDSSFAIGQSAKDPGLRYLKQIKARNTGQIYHSQNVCLAFIRKEKNFLGFEFFGFGSEHEHLKVQSDKERNSLVNKAKELSAAGRKNNEIAEALGVSAMTITRYLKK